MDLQKQFACVEIRGIRVAAIDVVKASDLIGKWAPEANGAYVTVTGAHGVVEAAYNRATLEAHQAASIVVADGMPLVWLGRALGSRTIGRVNGPELMELIFAREEFRKLRHYFYGGNPSAVNCLKNVLTARFGAFNMVGTYSPPVRSIGFNEDPQVLESIRALNPDFVWIGLSTPKQEVWMHMHMPKIGRGIGIGVGAAFDLLSGTTRRAPRWIQRSGFEWLFRLGVEPRRLYKRYFFVIPRFAYFLLETLIRQRYKGSAKVSLTERM